MFISYTCLECTDQKKKKKRINIEHEGRLEVPDACLPHKKGPKQLIDN